MRASGTCAAPFCWVVRCAHVLAIGRRGSIRREEAFSKTGDQLVEPSVVGDERALMVGPVRGRELLHALERAVAPESERVRATLGPQGVERLPPRDQPTSRRA